MHVSESLPVDVWSVLVTHMRTADFLACHSVSEAWRRNASDPIVDAAFADRYAEEVLGDAAFWRHAKGRPASTRRELASYRDEILRIERFFAESRLPPSAAYLYVLWRVLDASARD